ncbi:hypothetical protein IGI42_002528 [Enterococcus sp. AZ109]
MNIKKMRISDLKPAPYNPRIELVPGMEEFEVLKRSIEEFGFVDPPIFNIQTGNLVGGHQRVAVAEYLGLWEEIEVSVVDLPIDKEKALNAALNKISGRWDDEKLATLLEELSKEQIVLTGFSDNEVEDLLKSFSVVPQDLSDDFSNSEIDISDFSEDKFDCECPKCGFRFSQERSR